LPKKISSPAACWVRGRLIQDHGLLQPVVEFLVLLMQLLHLLLQVLELLLVVGTLDGLGDSVCLAVEVCSESPRC
jgi:hypothetical protein